MLMFINLPLYKLNSINQLFSRILGRVGPIGDNMGMKILKVMLGKGSLPTRNCFDAYDRQVENNS